MSNEFDLDDLTSLLANEEEEQEEKPLKKKKQAKQKQKSSIGGILLKSVLPASVTLICGTVLGVMLGGSASSTSNQTQTSQTEKKDTIVSIVDTVNLQDAINTITASQNKSLLVQLNEVTGKYSTSDYKNDTPYAQALNKVNAEVLDNLMQAVLNDNPNKTDQEREQAIKQFFEIPNVSDANRSKTDDAQTLEAKLSDEGKAVLSNLRNFVKGPSVSRLYQSETAKAGSVSTSMLNFSTSGAVYYQVIVPVATSKDNMVRQAMYIVKIKDGKVYAMSFAGTLTNNPDIASYYDALRGEIRALDEAEEKAKTSNDGNALGREKLTSDLPANEQSNPAKDEHVDNGAKENSSSSSSLSSSSNNTKSESSSSATNSSQSN